MTIQEQTSVQQQVLGFAAIAIEKALRNRSTLVVSAEARRLVGENPECKMTVGEMRDFMARLAAPRGVPIEF